MASIKKIKQCKINLVKDDLTAMDIEAIVFYANPDLSLGSGYGNEISMRGGPSIKKELEVIKSCETGKAVITNGGELKAKYIIHAVGPRFQEIDSNQKLKETIINSLNIASEAGISQIGFPPMGSGFFGIPLIDCANLMLESFREFLEEGSTIKEITLVAKDLRELKPFQDALASI